MPDIIREGDSGRCIRKAIPLVFFNTVVHRGETTG